MKSLISAFAFALFSLNAFAADIEIKEETKITKENIQEIVSKTMDEAYQKACQAETWQKEPKSFFEFTAFRLWVTEYLNITLLGHNPTENIDKWTFRGFCKKATIEILYQFQLILNEKYKSGSDFYNFVTVNYTDKNFDYSKQPMITLKNDAEIERNFFQSICYAGTKCLRRKVKQD